MKTKPTLNTKPNPFSFKKGATEISGDSNKKALIVLCYLRELRWLLGAITAAVIGWLSG
jgi:hypothetical protein